MELVRRLELDKDPTSVGAARRFVSRCCADWDVQDPEDVAPLVVSELVTNALQHADGPMTLFVARRLDRIVISVQDHSSTVPEAYDPGPLAENGRGLQLVDSLVADWGAQVMDDGKRVWAEVESAAISPR